MRGVGLADIEATGKLGSFEGASAAFLTPAHADAAEGVGAEAFEVAAGDSRRH